jgi:hypothetical protein
MHVPTEEELAAIALAYLAVQRTAVPPAPPVSRWRLAARALDGHEPEPARWGRTNPRR